jgi:SAM-dependent methyltransferase
MVQRIDKTILDELSRHTRGLGMARVFRSMAYERCIELPLIVSRLRPRFGEKLRYLDIGSGDSVLPSYFLAKTRWTLTLIDKFTTLNTQAAYAEKVMRGQPWNDRLTVVNDDFLAWKGEAGSYDIITLISVIEHFSGTSDSDGIRKAAELLAPGGLLVIVAPYNEGHARDFYMKDEVYGEKFSGDPVFFQRHYDRTTFQDRILTPSGLKVEDILYYGDYDIQYKETFTNLPWPWKPFKILYQWATPSFALQFARYSDKPVSRKDMHMYTASGVFVMLRK